MIALKIADAAPSAIVTSFGSIISLGLKRDGKRKAGDVGRAVPELASRVIAPVVGHNECACWPDSEFWTSNSSNRPTSLERD